MKLHECCWIRSSEWICRRRRKCMMGFFNNILFSLLERLCFWYFQKHRDLSKEMQILTKICLTSLISTDVGRFHFHPHFHTQITAGCFRAIIFFIESLIISIVIERRTEDDISSLSFTGLSMLQLFTQRGCVRMYRSLKASRSAKISCRFSQTSALILGSLSADNKQKLPRILMIPRNLST